MYSPNNSQAHFAPGCVTPDSVVNCRADNLEWRSPVDSAQLGARTHTSGIPDRVQQHHDGRQPGLGCGGERRRRSASIADRRDWIGAGGLDHADYHIYAMFDFFEVIWGQADAGWRCELSLRGVHTLNLTENPLCRWKTLSSRCFAG